MASINISLPGQMRDWVEGQIEAGHYHNASEYIRDLIRKDQAAQAQMTELRAHLAQGEQDIAQERYTDLNSDEAVDNYFARFTAE